MCTAISYNSSDHYFGRTLDLEYSYNETVTITPRFFPFHFKFKERMDYHYALIGMATVMNGYPLYYEATNEKGLSMAGLNFPNNARYFQKDETKDNITPFEFIPWVLGQCENITEARERLKTLNLVDAAFSPELPLSPLHWIISDKKESITVESTKEGLKVFENSVGVLANNPTFDYHLLHLSTYMNLTNKPPKNNFSDKICLSEFSHGTGTFGLPGDNSSSSRFVRAAYALLNSPRFENETESVNQFFHIMGTVSQIKGSVITEDGKYVITVYTSCCNTDKGIYYYTTYNNRTIEKVEMQKENLDSTRLIVHELVKNPSV